MLVQDVMQGADVLELFLKGMGAGEPSSRIDVRITEDSDALPELVDAVEASAAEISSIMTLSDRSGHKDVVIRIGSIDARPAIAELEARGFLVGNPKKG